MGERDGKVEKGADGRVLAGWNIMYIYSYPAQLYGSSLLTSTVLGTAPVGSISARVVGGWINAPMGNYLLYLPGRDWWPHLHSTQPDSVKRMPSFVIATEDRAGR